MSYVDIIQQRMSFTFDLGDNIYVALDLNTILRADIMTRYSAYRIGATGWLTVNEIRLAEGLNPVPGGDVVYRPVNMAPLGSDVFEAIAIPGEGDPPAVGSDPPALGSELTGTGGEGGGRPPDDGSDPAPAD